MDQAASDHVLALRVLHAGSIIMTHAVGCRLAIGNRSHRRSGEIGAELGYCGFHRFLRRGMPEAWYVLWFRNSRSLAYYALRYLTS